MLVDTHSLTSKLLVGLMSNILVDSVLAVLTSRAAWKRCAYAILSGLDSLLHADTASGLPGFGCRTCTARVAPRWTWTPQRRAPCRRGVLGILGRRAPSPRASRPCLRSSPRVFSGWPRAFASRLGCLEGCRRVLQATGFQAPRVGCSAFGGAPCVARGRRR